MITLGGLVERARRVSGGRLAVCCGDVEYTWAQLHSRMLRTIGVLRALGVGAGDRVAILGDNSERYFEWLLAIPAAGAIVVPINTRLAAPEIAELVADSGARVLLVDAPWAERAAQWRAQLTGIERFVTTARERPEGFDCLDELPTRDDAASQPGADIDQVAMLVYTGGTTGRSKGVMLTHRGIVTNTLQWGVPFDFRADEVVLIGAPMFHVVGAANAIAGAVFANPTVILPRFDPVLLFETVQARRPTRTSLVPTMIEMLVTHPDIGRYDLSSLRTMGYGGSPILTRTLALARAALPQARFYQAYGQTEGGPVISMLRPEDHVEENDRIRSAGQPIPGTLVEIRDPAGRPLPAGEIGEICVRSPTISPGYWKLPELSAETVRGGWHHTGDAGHLDDDGFLFVVDRIKDMIVTGGENVYAVEVENVLAAHPAVAGCAVIGLPHDRLVEQVHAVVRLEPGAQVDAAELIAFCRERLAGYKCPRGIALREAPFPLTPAGKILKRELRREYALGND